jgi:hypothetical protein
MAFLLYALIPEVLSVIFCLIINKFNIQKIIIQILRNLVDLNPSDLLKNLKPITTSALFNNIDSINLFISFATCCPSPLNNCIAIS